MEITLEDTSKVVALMRSMELYSSASYVKDMAERIAALEAEAGRVRAEALEEAALEVFAVAQEARQHSQHAVAREIWHRINALRTAAAQPETEAEVTDATMLRHMHAEMREENGGWTQDEDFD